MQRVAILLCLSLLTALASPVAAQRDFSAVEVRTQPLADGLFVLIGAGGNIALSVGDDGAFLVDDQFAPLTAKIRVAIGEVTDDEVRFVLNTHWHGDHTGGNENFAEAGAVIVAHDNTRTRMEVEQFVPLFDHRAPAAASAALPIVTFSETVTFHWNGQPIHAFHVQNAHTDGDAIIHFVDDDVYHMGDVYWSSGYPRIDAGNGGSIDGVIAAVERVLAGAGGDTRIIPGHGDLPPRGVEGLKAYLQMLVSIRGEVQKLIDRGLSEEAVVQAGPTRDFDATWGAGYVVPERFTRSVYIGLTED